MDSTNKSEKRLNYSKGKRIDLEFIRHRLYRMNNKEILKLYNIAHPEEKICLRTMEVHMRENYMFNNKIIFLLSPESIEWINENKDKYWPNQQIFVDAYCEHFKINFSLLCFRNYFGQAGSKSHYKNYDVKTIDISPKLRKKLELTAIRRKRQREEREKFNKDFYNSLPGVICASLDQYIEKYKDEPWFVIGWNKYREHILSCKTIDEMKMPSSIFNKCKANYLEEMEEKRLKEIDILEEK